MNVFRSKPLPCWKVWVWFVELLFYLLLLFKLLFLTSSFPLVLQVWLLFNWSRMLSLSITNLLRKSPFRDSITKSKPPSLWYFFCVPCGEHFCESFCLFARGGFGLLSCCWTLRQPRPASRLRVTSCGHSDVSLGLKRFVWTGL